NILWITCEDMSLTLGCYGDDFAITPNLDKLAAQGVRYTNAFAVGSVCTPSRSCLITGLYPTSLGSQHLRCNIRLPDHIRCFTEYLRKAGYYCTNNVKQDYNFVAPPDSWDESSKQAHWRKRKPDQKFFSVFNIVTTHQGQIRLPNEQFAKRTARLAPHQRHDPSKVTLPPYYPDTPVIRRDMARFYDLVTAMDKRAGDLLHQLAEDGLTEDTIVFFYSDHGTGMPRHKRWLYDSGLRVPLIIRFPQKYQHLAPGKPGTTIERLVSFVDFAPTVLSLAGIKPPPYMQGSAFLGEQSGEPRQYVFGVRDRVDECYEMSRAIHDGRYKYIRHYMPHRPFMQLSEYSERTPTRQELRRLAAQDRLNGAAKRLLAPSKPAEELYDTQNDRYELHNLADSPNHQKILQRMREILHSWMIETRDTGLLPEAEMHLRCGEIPPYELADRPNTFPIERILEVAEMVGMGPEHRPRLIEKLGDSDSTVRYWAAVGLTAPGLDARPALKPLLGALGDPSPNVRFAAAEVLCVIGRAPEALPVLVEGLHHQNKWARLHAAMSLVAIGDRARPVLKDIEKILANEKETYIRSALGHVLNNLRESAP
ncbi:MAG: sulfatase-like hydrolase/transferase, partial [Planctomycetota bacterium]